MIYLLLGKDSYTKKSFIDGLLGSQTSGKSEGKSEDRSATKSAIEKVELFAPETEREILVQASGQSLFSSKKLLVIYDALQKLDGPKLIEELQSTEDIIVFVEESLDKRKKETKSLLADKRIIIKEFAVPVGADFQKWLLNQAKERGITLQPQAARHLAQRLGDDGRQDISYNLWQAVAELQKLAAYASSDPNTAITPAEIDLLVAESFDQDVFRVTNAIADRKPAEAINLLNDFIERVPGNDEKGKIINLAAILAEQFRGLYAFQSLLSRSAPDAEIIKATGFTPGRVFVYKKLSRSFAPQKLLEALRKLEALDGELKSTTGPAALQFLLTVQGLMK
jgi:DNA polymerase-3 subunit delta